MKRIIGVILCSFVACAGALHSIANTETVNGIPWTYTVSNGAASIGAPAVPTATTGAITIPDSLGGYPVTSIGNHAFSDCSGLTSVTIPDSVTNIGSYAFSNCIGLTSVTIPDSVTNIGSYAFYHCRGLTSVTIGNGVTSIGEGAFYYCGGLTNVTIGNGVTSIGSSAFYGCFGLTSVTIPNSVTSIGERAFYDCRGLEDITLPFVGACRGNTGSRASLFGYIFGSLSFTGSTETRQYYSIVDYERFYIPTCLKKVVVTDETELGYGAFNGCSGLASVILPNTVTSVWDRAFSGCSGLTSVTIPDSVTSIGARAFEGCSGLTSVTIPNSVTSIGNYAFDGCSGLEDITLPFVGACRGNTGSRASLFGYIFGSLSFTGSTETRQYYSSANYARFYIPTCLKKVVVTDETELGYGAFYNCSGLASVTIPDSVTSIGERAFYGCSGLASVTIPDSVTSIGERAFSGCSGLTSVTIPGSVTSIGNYAFDGCSELKDVVVPRCVIGRQIRNVFSSSYSSITNVAYSSVITYIADYAFSNCSGLTSVTIPDSVKSIEYCAFYGCSGLASVTIPNSVTRIGEGAFRYCSGLTSVTIPDSVKSIEYCAFSGCRGLTSVTIPNSVTRIGEGAFSGCSGLTSVTIGNGVTSIGSSAFSGCSGLTSVTIPNSVTRIGEGAFSGCSGLTSVTIPDSVTSIGERAFSGCSGLTSVTIPDSVTSIGSYAFKDCNNWDETIINVSDIAALCTNAVCSKLQGQKRLFVGGVEMFDLQIPDGVTSIAGDAFSGCSGLTSLTIPDSVTSIGDYAFSGCSGITRMTIPDSVMSIGDYAFNDCNNWDETIINVSDIAALCTNAVCSKLQGQKRLFVGGVEMFDLQIPDGVTSIGGSAFKGCSGLASVTIPDSVTSIGNGAFSGCSGLKDATIPQKVCDWGMSYVFPSAYKTITNVVISESATSIGSSAFYGCKGLTGVAIPDSVTNIADYAFADCTNLQTEVQGGYKVMNGWVVGYTDKAEETIPEADNLKGICSGALKGCTALKRLEFGDRARLVSIGAEALKGCTELKTLVLPPSLTRIGKEAFMGCSYLDDVIVPGGVKSVGARAFKNCTGFTYAQIEHGVESIGEEAFCGCWRITEVDIPSSVSSIGQNAFGGDSSITKVALRGDIRRVSQIFANYQSIREATVKAGSGSLVDGLFSGCSSLETVRFLGDCPALANNGANLYEDANWSLVTYVSKDSTGWDGTAGSHTLPMAWPLVGSYRRDITYADDISAPHAVAFDANGGTPKTQNVEQRSETPFVLPKEPTRAGYTFAGWWTEKNGGVKVTSGTVFIEGVYSHLYAHWLKPGQIVLEGVFSGTGKVSLDENGNIVVVLTVDVSGTVEIPDNIGAVTVDLNGYVMTGNEGPAIRIVKGDGEGETTRLVIADTADGEKGQIVGCGESAGIEVAEDAATGVRLDVEEGVGVFNGDGSEQELKPKLVGTGKVTVPRTWKVGQKVTWKATADKGSVFARWEGPLVDSLNLTKNERRNPSLAFAVPEGFETNMVTAVFIPIDDDGLYSLGITQTEFDLKETVSDVRVTDDSQSYVTATASGLPTGLKFDAKKMKITGTPTKSGVYWVQIKAKNASGYQWAENVMVTVSGDGKEAKVPKLTRTAHHPLTVICANEGGTVSGTGVYAEGKKVSVKATPAKGYVFAGWHETANSEKGTVNGVDGADYRSASLNVTVPEMRYVFALFATKEDDADSLKVAVEDVTTEKDGTIALDLGACVESLSLPKLAVSGLPTGLKYDAKALKVVGKATKPGVYTVTVKATNASVTRATDATTATFKITVPNFECAALPGLKPETDAYGTIHAGVKFGPSLIDCTPADGWTVKAAGLPAGLKFAAKETKDATYGVVPAWTIYGVPTAKTGAYTVTFTASKKGEKNQVATITLNVEALPAWAVGNFEGFVRYDENDGGFATMSITAAGKVSGKIAYGGTNWTFKADSFAIASETVGYTNLALRTVATSGKATLDFSLNMVDFLVDSLPSSTTSFAEGYFGEVYTMMYRLPWKDKNDTDAASLIASYAGAYSCKVPYGDDSGDVTFVLDEKGAVKGTVILPDGAKTRKATFSCNVLPNYDSLSVVIALPPDAKKGYPAVFKVVNLVNHSGEGADYLAFRDPGVVTAVAELTAESGAIGTVSVNPKYGQVAPGKDVALTAKAAKGSVFHRWEITGVDTEGLDLSSSTLKIKMTDVGDVFATAVFATAEEDAASLALDLADAKTKTDGTLSLDLGACVSSLSLAKLTVAGLPAGLKYDAKTKTISGKATKPGLYTVKVTATNASATGKNAIVGQFTIEVPNFTAANGFFVDDLYNDVGEKYTLSVGISNIDDFLPSLELNNATVKLAVSGLPSGLKYDAKIGKITGIATKAGTYTVTFTVTDGKAKYVSTITIEVEALPDWVVGTFEGYLYDDYDDSDIGFDIDKFIITINEKGSVSAKRQDSNSIWYDESKFIIKLSRVGDTYRLHYKDHFIYEPWIDILPELIDGCIMGCMQGVRVGYDEDYDRFEGFMTLRQNVWKKGDESKLVVSFVNKTASVFSMEEMMVNESFQNYGGYLTLKYGANGAVTTAYSEIEGGNATATGSAQLVPYEVDGNITKAWLYTALKPIGRDPFGVLLFLSIDTSNGNVYGDDVTVEDYLLEVEE